RWMHAECRRERSFCCTMADTWLLGPIANLRLKPLVSCWNAMLPSALLQFRPLVEATKVWHSTKGLRLFSNVCLLLPCTRLSYNVVVRRLLCSLIFAGLTLGLHASVPSVKSSATLNRGANPQFESPYQSRPALTITAAPADIS